MKKDKKMWRSPVCQDAKFGNTPPHRISTTSIRASKGVRCE